MLAKQRSEVVRTGVEDDGLQSRAGEGDLQSQEQGPLAVKGGVGIDNASSLQHTPAIVREGRDPGLRGEVESIVRKTMLDASRRKQNVIVSGLPECDSRADVDLFSDLCSSHFQLNLSVVSARTRRIGKASNQPRRLLVGLSSEMQASEVLRKARDLRHSSDSYTAENVYINPDLSREAAKAAYDRRQRYRAEKTARENNISIVPGSSTDMHTEAPGYTVWNSSRRPYRSNTNLIPVICTEEAPVSMISKPTVVTPAQSSVSRTEPTTSASGNASLNPNAMDYCPFANPTVMADAANNQSA